MIQPSAPSPATALTPVAAVAGEAREGAEASTAFAAVLGLQLQATAAGDQPVAAVAQGAGDPEQSPLVENQSALVQNQGALTPRPSPLILSLSKDASATLVPTSFDKLRMSGGGAERLTIESKPEPDGQNATEEHEAPETAPLLVALPVLPASMPDAASTPAARSAPPAPVQTSAPSKTEAKAGPDATPSSPLTSPEPVFTPLIETPAAPIATFQPAVPYSPARHDFAALVDRLVEARDTALIVQTPQHVAAAVTHSDFGEVSIRFEHRGDALSVSLASADPDFTRAVQAAAPAPQTDANSAQHQRHEGSGQQLSAGSGNSHQSQQRQGSAPARGPVRQEHDGTPQQGAQGGIFA